MSSDRFKGLLKSFRGGLKLTVVLIPAVFATGVFVSGVTLLAMGMGKYNKVMDEYSTTDTFIQRAADDFNEALNSLANKEISNEEYEEKLQHFGSSEYKEDLIKEDREENLKFQPILKQANLKSNWGLGLLVGGIISAFVDFIIYGKYAFELEDLLIAGKEEIKEGYKNMFAKSRKKESINDQSLVDTISTEKKEIKSAYKEDEEKIESIDENYL